MVLDSRGWTSSVVGNVSKWINLDSACARSRLAAEKVFKQEIAWATHLSVPAVVLPALRNHTSCANYARVLNQSATQAQYLQVNACSSMLLTWIPSHVCWPLVLGAYPFDLRSRARVSAARPCCHRGCEPVGGTRHCGWNGDLQLFSSTMHHAIGLGCAALHV